MDFENVSSFLLADGWHFVENGLQLVADPTGQTHSESSYLPSWFQGTEKDKATTMRQVVTGPLSSILAYRYPPT